MAAEHEKAALKEHEDDLDRRATQLTQLSVHATDKTKLSFKMKLALFVTYVACTNFGFQAAIIGSTLGQPSFFEAFPEAGTNSNITGAIVCMTNAGGFVGVVICALVADRFGRRAGFLTAMLSMLLGAGLAAGARNVAMLCVGRMFVGLGGWGGIMSSMAYVQELAPTASRGHIGGGVGPALNSGYIWANWIQVGLYYYSSPFNWRLAQLLQIVLPIFVLIGLPFMPESPRWLIYHDKREAALQVFKELHSDPNDPEHYIARLEHLQVCKQVEVDNTLSSSWVGMFIKYRRRTLTGMLIMTVNQLTGPQVITSYGATIYAQAGLAGSTPLIVQASWNIWGFTTSFIWLQFIDKFGRKKSLQYGLAGLLVVFSIITALYAEFVEKAATHANPAPGRNALIAFFFIYLIPYELCEPAMFAWVGEVFPTHVRTKGIALCLVAITVTAAWLTMAFPVGVSAAGWKFYLLMICCMAVGLVAQQFLIVETRGVPLEEMSALFNDSGDVAVYAKDLSVRDLLAAEAQYGYKV